MTTAALKSPTRSTRRMTGRIVGIVGISILIIVALIETLPFVFTIANSFKCLPAINQNPAAIIPLPPFGIECVQDGRVLSADQTSTTLTFNPTLDGYREVFAANLPLWFINSVIFAVAITILHLILDSLAGYALSRIKFPGNRAIFFIILGTLMIPGVVLLIPRFIILQQLGILNTYQGLIIPLAADAFGIFLMKQFFDTVPVEIEEAAMVDGANRFRIFFRVVLPLATPALTALAIFSFQGQWNNFMDALIIIGGNPRLYTLPLGLATLRGASGETLRWHQFLAGAVITTIPLAIVFFTFQRYFVEGTSYSGLAGQ
jgi:multiple sugar transport system permease protein